VTLGQVGDFCSAKLKSYGGREMYVYIMIIVRIFEMTRILVLLSHASGECKAGRCISICELNQHQPCSCDTDGTL